MTTNPFGTRTLPRVGFVPAFLFVACFALVPAIATLVLSFTDISGVPDLPINWVGLDNYFRFFSPAQASDAMRALVNTAIFAIVVTIVQNVIALLVAVLLTRGAKGSVFTRSVIFLPSVLGVTIVGLIWTLFFNPLGGPAQSIVGLFGIRSSFFGDPALALGLCIAAQIWMTMGYCAAIYTAGLQAIPAELYEAAAIDGASGWRRLTDVTVPMLAPSITANMLLSIIGSLQAFQLIFVLTGAQNQATSVLSLYLYKVGFAIGRPGSGQEQGYASAISIVQFVLVGIVAIISYTILRRREEQL